jgi:hypothetical protein
VPGDDGLGLDDDQALGPIAPHAAQGSPEQPIQPIQTGTGPFPFEDRNLLSQGEDFQGGVAPTAEEDSDGGQDRENEFGHELTLVTWRDVARAGQRLQAANC